MDVPQGSRGWSNVDWQEWVEANADDHTAAWRPGSTSFVAEPVLTDAGLAGTPTAAPPATAHTVAAPAPQRTVAPGAGGVATAEAAPGAVGGDTAPRPPPIPRAADAVPVAPVAGTGAAGAGAGAGTGEASSEVATVGSEVPQAGTGSSSMPPCPPYPTAAVEHAGVIYDELHALPTSTIFNAMSRESLERLHSATAAVTDAVAASGLGVDVASLSRHVAEEFAATCAAGAGSATVGTAVPTSGLVVKVEPERGHAGGGDDVGAGDGGTSAGAGSSGGSGGSDDGGEAEESKRRPSEGPGGASGSGPPATTRVSSVLAGQCFRRTHYYWGESTVDEGLHIEFKQLKRVGTSGMSVIKKYIGAFLNSQGGTLYMGIHDAGLVMGMPMDQQTRVDLRRRVTSWLTHQLQVPRSQFRVSFTPVVPPPPGVQKPRGTKAPLVHPWGVGFVMAISVEVDLRRKPLQCVMDKPPSESWYVRYAATVMPLSTPLDMMSWCTERFRLSAASASKPQLSRTTQQAIHRHNAAVWGLHWGLDRHRRRARPGHKRGGFGSSAGVAGFAEPGSATVIDHTAPVIIARLKSTSL